MNRILKNSAKKDQLEPKKINYMKNIIKKVPPSSDFGSDFVPNFSFFG